MKNKRIVALLCSLFLMSSLALSAFAIDPASMDANLPADRVLLSIIQDTIDAYEDHYLLHSVEVTDKYIHQVDDDGFAVDFIVELAAELKYESAAQLPHVQAMAAGLGINSAKLTTTDLISALDSSSTKSKLTNMAIEKLTTSEIDLSAPEQFELSSASQIANTATNEIKKFVTELEELYIGQVSTINLIYRATFDADGDPISIAAVAYDNTTYDAQLLAPETESAMRANGTAQLQSIIDNAATRAQTTNDVQATNSVVYYRVTARNYANSWTSNPTSGTKDTSKWRIRSNPNATAPYYPANSSDCANYVSQAIYAGGIPKTDSSVNDRDHWFASEWGCSIAWESCDNMHYYFTENDYWSESNYANCNAGGVIFMKDSTGDRYHVVMCVQNDTATRLYSAHTHDRLQVRYTGVSSFGDDCDELEYWVFTNSVAE